MSGIINKVKEVLHGDKSSTTSTTHTSGTGYNTGAGHTGLGSGPGVGHAGNNVPEGTAGPHASRVANAADPRVDSDLDSSRHTGAGVGGVGSGITGSHGVHSTTQHSTAGGVGSGITGSHGVHSTTQHSTAGGVGSGITGTHGVHGTTQHSTGAGYGTSNTTAGPHSSDLLNKVDPRVDSDLDGSRTAPGGTNTYSGSHVGNTSTSHTGTTGGLSHSTNAGPHNSSVLNTADPRVDSDLDGRGNRHGAATGGVFGASGSHATAGSGTAQNTAGPHNSDLLNKVDPRVDSDRDGSKTYGGNKTHS